MTICIATACYTGNGNRAILTASDRMITGGDIQYEPRQMKMCRLTPSSVLLVAGPYQINSEAINKTTRDIVANPVGTLEEIAEIYGSNLRKIRMRRAEQTYLAPWGLNLQSFLDRQGQLTPDFSSALIRELDSFPVQDCEAILAGFDSTGIQLCHIDSLGRVSFHNDIGFLAIGSGATHAKSLFMQLGYTNNWIYSHSLLATYAAKKKAEIAPGVGAETDMHFIDERAVGNIVPAFYAETQRLYRELKQQTEAIALAGIASLTNFIANSKIPESESQLPDNTNPDNPSPETVPESEQEEATDEQEGQ